MEYILSTTADFSLVEEGDWPWPVKNSLLTPRLARQHGLRLEIAELCLANYLDDRYPEGERVIREKLSYAPAAVLHAPYNELFPSAIDPRAAALAESRYSEALAAAASFGIQKVVIHSGFAPDIYFQQWFLERSVWFWKKFLREHPGDFVICLENVMEDEPTQLRQLVETVDDPRLRLCLDVGHAYRSSKTDPVYWLRDWAPWLSHFHIHNNEGVFDTHDALDAGHIAMEPFLREAERLCPEATCTVESLAVEESVRWLVEKGFLED